MSIRIPQKADTDTQSAFQDVEKALAELSARLDQVTELEQKVKELSIVSDTPRPSFITQGDTVIEGDLRVEGGLAVRGDVDAPQVLDGIVVATPEGIGSSAQRVVEVHGSLAVLSALSAENIRTRNLQVYGTITNSAVSTLGRPVLLYQRTGASLSDSGGGETTMSSYSLDADTWMSTDGDRIIIETWNQIPAASTWTFSFKYGSVTLSWSDIGYGAAARPTRFYVEIVRTGASAQLSALHFMAYGTASGSPISSILEPAVGAQSNSGTVTVSTTITDASQSTEYWSKIWAIKAP